MSSSRKLTINNNDLIDNKNQNDENENRNDIVGNNMILKSDESK